MFKRFFLNKSIIYRNYCEKITNVRDLLENAASYDDLKVKNDENNWSSSPYPNVIGRRDQKLKGLRPKIDPRETTIILFPGQGTQYVGMGRDLVKYPEARDIFELASEVLKYDVLKLCIEGPKEKLDKTIFAQPAIVVCSLAALEMLKDQRPNAIDNCVATAGFSLGEITSLIFAGSIPFDKALKLIQIRAEAMQALSDQYPSGMATILYGPGSDLSLACKDAISWCIDRGIEEPECCVSNYLYPHCKIIGGSLEALKYVETNLKKYKLKRFKRLPVSGAFHTKYMTPAVEIFRNALKKIRIDDPLVPVYSNVDGKRYQSASHILKQLPKQIVKPVKWEQTLHILYERGKDEHFPKTYECGPGKGLTLILKQVNAKAWDSAFNIEA